jgi:hypothetical protein
VKADRVLTQEKRIGFCPACRTMVKAELTIAVKVGDPVLDDDGKIDVPTESDVTKVSIVHRCDGKGRTVGESEPDL